MGGGICFLEALDVAKVGAAPFVNGLVAVAHGEDVVVGGGEALDEGVLGGVGVLEFVNEDMLVFFLVGLQDVGTFVEEEDGVHHQVVEVHGVVGLEGELVLLVDAAGDFGDVGGGGVEVGGDEFVFGTADAVEQFGWREFFVVDVEFFEHLFDDLQLVGGVEDDEVALVVEEGVGFAAQDAGADGVEGAHGEAARIGIELFFDAVVHFFGRFVGEGDGEDVPGCYVHFAHEVDDAVGEDTGFTTAGTC